MGRSPAPCDYEDLRNARILENQARLASLGLQKTIHELRSLASQAKPVREYRKKVYSIGSLRRSERLRGKPALRSASVPVRRPDHLIGRFTADTKSEKGEISHLRRSNRLKPIAAESVPKQPTASDSPNCSSGLSLEGSGHEVGGEFSSTGGKSIRPANKPLLKLQGLEYHLSADDSSRRCNSKGRGSIKKNKEEERKKKNAETGSGFVFSVASYWSTNACRGARMGRSPAPCDYEDLRNARIVENQARLASLGLQKTIHELRSLASQAKPVREYRKKVYSIGSLRRSERLRGKPALRSASVPVRRPDHLIGRFTADTKSEKGEISHLRRSNRLKPIAAESVPKQPTASDSPNCSSGLSLEGSGHEVGGEFSSTGGKSIRPANKPLLKLQGLEYHLSADDSSRRCNSKGRGSIKKNKEEERKKKNAETGSGFVFSVASYWSTNACRGARMGRSPAPCDYEDLRNARILENQARLASLGLQKTIHELRSLASQAKPVREYRKKVYSIGSLRRSERLRGKPALRSASVPVRRPDHLIGRFTADTKSEKGEISHLRRSNRLKPIAAESVPKQPTASDSPNCSSGLSLEGSGHEVGGEFSSTGGKSIRPANKPLLKLQGLEYHLSADDSSRRCNSKGRGSIYDPLFGISCHFCRQKKLCGEEACKRCGELDMDEPCIGKTDCSVCHSAIGVLCRGCLKVRYGEEMEEVRENKDWMCPHCVEATGSNPYWICNSSICLKKRNRAPTGIAVYRAWAMGYKSVAHLLMDELQRAAKRRR